MVGYFKNAPKDDAVLLKEIVGIIQAYYGDGAEPFLAELVLTKAREAVEGAGLKLAEIMAIRVPAFADGTKLAIRDIKVMGKAIAEAQTKAILKALGGE